MILQPNAEAQTVVATTLARCTYTLRDAAPHVTVPVEVADLSRYVRDSIAYVRAGEGGHDHPSPDGHEPDLPDFGHVDIISNANEHGHGIVVRRRVMGLYFLPTAAYPGGRISIERALSLEMQVEVLVCEIAHAIDYVVMTPDQRREILYAYHGGQPPSAVGHVSDWFEEEGELSYASWAGESFMFGVLLAYTDMRPSFDFFTHKSTPDVVDTIRRVLTPPPAEKRYGFRKRKVWHRASCWVLGVLPSRAVILTDDEIAARRPCRFCGKET